MEIVTITDKNGFFYKRIVFSFSPNVFYSVEQMTKTLVLNEQISNDIAYEIEISKTIEDQLEMLKPFELYLTKLYQFAYEINR